MAGLITRNIVINIPRCVSLAVVFDLLSFYFPSLADQISCEIQCSRKQDWSSFMALQFIALKVFISSRPRSTDIEWSLDYSYVVHTCFVYLIVHSFELWVGCEMHEFLNSVFRWHFCFLSEKIARGKKPPVSLLEHIYGPTDFLDQHWKCSQKRLIILMYFMFNIYRDK